MAPGGAGAGVTATDSVVVMDSVVATATVVVTATGAVTAIAAAMLDAEPTAEEHVVTREEHAADSAAELLGVDSVEELPVVDSAAAVMVAAVDTAKIDLHG